jgi:hypothetical protein
MTYEDFKLMQQTLNTMDWDSETQEEDVWYEGDWWSEEIN